MIKYYVMDVETPWSIIKNLCCYTRDIEKYIRNHNYTVVENLREISKKKFTEVRKAGQTVTYK